MSDLFASDTPVDITGYAHVALERGIDTSATGYTYAVPTALADLTVGERVIVPLGRGDKRVAGYVVERMDEPGTLHKVKPILERDPRHVSLPADLVELAKWIAAYYVCPLGMVFGSMLPAAVARGTGATLRTMVRKTHRESGEQPKPTKLQRAILDAASETDWVEIKALADAGGAKTTGPVKRLIDEGLLESKREETVVSDLDVRAQREVEKPKDITLNGAQGKAVDHLVSHIDRGFGVHLLHGVTGSGKTEVYLRLLDSVVNQADSKGEHDPGAIILVPEISLTPQTVARFLARFDPERVAVLHSGLTAAQRHTQWRRIRDGRANIVIGARSAIFAPLPRLDLVIVDEEHEHSYKQDQLPRYHARDVAIKRGQMAGIPVVLGSATPSLESYFNAAGSGFRVPGSGVSDQAGTASSPTPKPQPPNPNYHLVRLPERVAGQRMPTVETIDMIEERRQRRGIHLMSQRLEYEIEQTVLHKHQAILLLNRRGYANYIACPDHRCGWMMTCDYCDVTAVYHKDKHLPAGGVVRCHHCGAENLLPPQCPQCGKKVNTFGLGTQRVEEEIKSKFPGLRAVRMDSDVMRTGRDYADTLDAFRAEQIDVLLGTQMIAKGLDFPNVRLVGVISADQSLHLPDFRAGERTFQLIAQVAGRAGRSDRHAGGGKVIVQTFNPSDPVIGFAARHDYEGFAEREIALRGEVGLPPIARMARIVVRDRDHLAGYERIKTLSDHLLAWNEKLETEVRLRGPAPCPIARIAEHHRFQLELLASPPEPAARLQKLLTAVRNTGLLTSDAHTAIDVDPVALL